jgi:signal peptidase I
MAKEEGKKEDKAAEAPEPLKKKIQREIIGWMWVILAFLFIHGTLLQARVIPSESMVETLLVGDHLLVSRFGYSAEVPFTGWRAALWRTPERQQMVVFRAKQPGSPDLVKRVIGVPGDTIEIRQRAMWINGKPLVEPYLNVTNGGMDDFGPMTVPPGNFFVMGDNRGNSYDSRFWGFVPRDAILGSPVIIYMSVDASREAWEPGQLRERVYAYLHAVISPSHIRWKRLFVTF